MNRTEYVFWYAIAFIIFGATMLGLHWLMTGISEDYGMGLISGLFIGVGLIFLLSRSARSL